jgi:hypothetical protein
MNPRTMTRQQAREVVLLLVGISAPVGLLVVNGAAFVMEHLADFRLSIGIAVVASSLALSGLTAQVVLGRVAVFAPGLYSRYRLWMIGAAVVSVIAWSLLGGWGAYQSMADARTLPNVYAVLTALWLVALPFAMNLVSRRLRGGRSPAPAGPDVEPPSRM